MAGFREKLTDLLSRAAHNDDDRVSDNFSFDSFEVKDGSNDSYHSGAGAHVAVQPSLRNELRPLVSSIVFAGISLVAVVAFIILCASGMVTASQSASAALLILLFILMVAFLGRNFFPKRIVNCLRVVRPLIIIGTVPIGFLLIETSYNDVLFSMGLRFVLLNLLILAAIFVIIYFFAQRSRVAVFVFLALCLIMGTTNHFVTMFKGYPLTPADLLAISTAAEVAGGYEFVLDDSLVVAFSIFAGYCILLALVPKVKITRNRLIVNIIIAIIVLLGFGWWVSDTDFEESYDFSVDSWWMTSSFNQYGTALCFLDLTKTLVPEEPQGYSEYAAEEILSDAEEEELQQGDIAATDDLAVIVVMNETFADPSIYPGFEEAAQYLSAFYEISDDSLEAGTAYTSTFGGGTCNSEFELLTGLSCGLFNTGYTYPYTTYDFSKVPNLARYFSSLGYATHAIHPGEATNWHRDVVYEEMGFDDFADVVSFYDDPGLRAIDLKTDHATYDYVLDLLANDAGNQFIFDLTIQNHGGYDRGGFDEDDLAHVTLPDGDESADLNEYVTCLKYSDNDLAYFVDALNELDRPVVLCFFGDHQATLSNWMYEVSYGINPEEDADAFYESDLASIQTEFEVPYFVWANAAATGTEAQEGKYEAATYDATFADESVSGAEWEEIENENEEENEEQAQPYYFLNGYGEYTEIYKDADADNSYFFIDSDGDYIYIEPTQYDGRQYFTLDEDGNYVRIDAEELNGDTTSETADEALAYYFVNENGNLIEFYRDIDTDGAYFYIDDVGNYIYIDPTQDDGFEYFYLDGGGRFIRFGSDEPENTQADERQGENPDETEGEGSDETEDEMLAYYFVNENGDFIEFYRDVEADGAYFYIDSEGYYSYLDPTPDDGREYFCLNEVGKFIPISLSNEGIFVPSDRTDHPSTVTSLNYLGARMLSYTTLPLTDYQKLLLQTSEEVPVVNLSGYLLPNGTWHALDDDTYASKSLNDLAIVQYYNLFG